MAVRVWSATVGKEMHDLVGGLLVSGEVIPEPGQDEHVYDLIEASATHIVASFRLVCGFRF